MSLSKVQSKHIQILRGLAIIAVVFIHNTPDGLPQVIIRPFLNFSVGMFLFLSGLLSSRNSWNPIKRIVKVAVPYAIWTFVYVLLKSWGSLSAIPVNYVKMLILGNSAAIMYYIFVYCQFTLLIPLIDKLANSKYKYLGFVVSPVEIILMRMIPMLTGTELNFYIETVIHLSCFGWFTYFYLGYLIGNGKISFKYSNKALVAMLALSVGVQMLEGYWFMSFDPGNCGTQLKLSALLCGVIFALLGLKFINSEKECKCKLLHILGNHSFGIYFSHLVIMRLMCMMPWYKNYVIYPINAIVAVALAFLFCYIGKKILKKYSWIVAL